jgi:hypothetical protein
LSFKRQACADSGVHGVFLQGIHGSPTHGAYSVCLSGVYEDDKDEGESLYVALVAFRCLSALLKAFICSVYTGTGGKDDPFSVSQEAVPSKCC